MAWSELYQRDAIEELELRPGQCEALDALCEGEESWIDLEPGSCMMTQKQTKATRDPFATESIKSCVREESSNRVCIHES